MTALRVRDFSAINLSTRPFRSLATLPMAALSDDGELPKDAKTAATSPFLPKYFRRNASKSDGLPMALASVWAWACISSKFHSIFLSLMKLPPATIFGGGQFENFSE